MTKIATTDNLADPFAKALSTKVFDRHMDCIGIRCNLNWIMSASGSLLNLVGICPQTNLTNKLLWTFF